MASKLQLTIYLLGICLFSICFLVFVNATISFVITDIIHQKQNVGDAAGTLGFADELLAVAACPAWGLLSDRVGYRTVSVIGYAVIAVALFALVQSVNVYPQLLLGRLLFSLGASCVSTMVTAILPSMVSKSPSIARNQSKPDAYRHNLAEKSAHSRLAGLVGLFTGTGALLAVGLYLPLPSRLQQAGLASERALADTYYIAGATAVVVAIACYLGLNASNRDPAGESQGLQNANPIGKRASKFSSYLPQALRLGLTKPSLGLAFLASFVARSSSVGISLFIPLFVNASLCDHPAKDIEEVETHCRRAYVTAAQLTGVSQLFALLFAPIFGFAPSQYRNVHVPLMLATVSGAVGYTAFAKMNTSETSPALFVVVALLGISQIGAIVSSLSLVSSFVNQERSPQGKFVDDPSCPVEGHAETSPLIDTPSTSETFEYLKGTIAGVYSLFGSLAILILTKFGGLLFDRLGPESPFYLLAIFNLSLLFALLGCDFVESYKRPD